MDRRKEDILLKARRVEPRDSNNQLQKSARHWWLFQVTCTRYCHRKNTIFPDIIWLIQNLLFLHALSYRSWYFMVWCPCTWFPAYADTLCQVKFPQSKSWLMLKSCVWLFWVDRIAIHRDSSPWQRCRSYRFQWIRTSWQGTHSWLFRWLSFRSWWGLFCLTRLLWSCRRIWQRRIIHFTGILLNKPCWTLR